MTKQCKKCGKNCEGDFCFLHKPRKAMKQGSFTKISPKKVKIDSNKTIMREMFLSIWKKRKHNSEISGEYLGSEALSTYFHHILPKEKHPEACLDEENIILLSLDEHTNVESNIYRYDEINKRRDILKRKYNIL